MKISCVLLSGSLVVFWPGTLAAQVTAEQVIENAHQKFSVNSCRKAANQDEIVVCAPDNSKFRLPLPIERKSIDGHDESGLRRLAVDADLPRECGVFRHQRRCNLRDNRKFGYGGGSVPIRALVMLAKKAVDPDTEIGPLGGYPVDPNEVK